MVKKTLILIAIGLSFNVFAQHIAFPKFELFSKNSLGIINYQNENTTVINNELSFYINSFGNSLPCDDLSFGQCLFTNIIMAISAFEITAGIDTQNDRPNLKVLPKFGILLRPLYYGKIGLNFNRESVYFISGITIPINNNLIELLYQKDIQGPENQPNSIASSRYQIGIQFPLLKQSKENTKNKRVFY